MATLIIQENGAARTRAAVNGEEITVAAPCNCTEVTGVQIAGVQYPFYDACGNNVSNISGKFSEGSLIRVLIDTTNTRAQIINQASASITNETKALFGLGADAVPDDVFRVLSRFQNGLGNEYVWEKAKYAIVNTDVSNKQILDTTSTHFNIATNVSISDGGVSLVSPVDSGALMASDIVSTPSHLRGKYIQQPALSNDIYYCSSSATFARSAQKLIASSGVSLVSAGADISYVNSPDPNAYPINDGYTYMARGQLGAAFGGVKIETGSYTGTGTYGVNETKHCSLSFAFRPKLVIIGGIYNVSNGYMAIIQPEVCGFMFNQNIGSQSGSNAISLKTTLSGNTVTWGNEANAHNQMNISGVTYKYIAIG